MDDPSHQSGHFHPNGPSSLFPINYPVYTLWTLHFCRSFTFTDRLLSWTIRFRRPSTLVNRSISKAAQFRLFRLWPSTLDWTRFLWLTFYSDVTGHALRICRLGSLTKIISYWPFVDAQGAIFISYCTFPIIKTLSRSRNFSSVTWWTAWSPFWPFAPVCTADVP